MNTPDLHLLAWELEAHGVARHEAALVALSSAARAAGVSPVLVDVLGDAAAPEVARLRAFGRVAAQLGVQRAPSSGGEQVAARRRPFRPRRRVPHGKAAA